MVKSRNIVEIDNQDECSIPLVQKFAVEEICQKFRRNLSRLLPEYEKSAAILGLVARSQFLHMRGAENWDLRKANLDTSLGVTRLPHPETTRIRSQEISGKCFSSGSNQKKRVGGRFYFFVLVRITAAKTCKTSDIHLSSIWLASAASVSVRFRSKERGTRVKDRAKNGSRLISHAIKPKIPFHGLFLLRNQTETLATQATIG